MCQVVSGCPTYSLSEGRILKKTPDAPTATGLEQRHFATLNEAAARYGCSVKTLRRNIAAGQIRAYRMGAGGRAIRVDLLESDPVMAVLINPNEFLA